MVKRVASIYEQERILGVLRESKADIPITNIAKRVNLHRATVAKYLAVLEAKGFVRYRAIGKAKLYSVINRGVVQ